MTDTNKILLAIIGVCVIFIAFLIGKTQNRNTFIEGAQTNTSPVIYASPTPTETPYPTDTPTPTPVPKPSSEAVLVAVKIYALGGNDVQQLLRNTFSGGTGSVEVTIANFALALDRNPIAFIKAETLATTLENSFKQGVPPPSYTYTPPPPLQLQPIQVPQIQIPNSPLPFFNSSPSYNTRCTNIGGTMDCYSSPY